MSNSNFWFRFFYVGSKYISQGPRFIKTLTLWTLCFCIFSSFRHLVMSECRSQYYFLKNTQINSSSLPKQENYYSQCLLLGIILFQTFIQKYFRDHFIFEIFCVLKWGLFSASTSSSLPYPSLIPKTRQTFTSVFR